MEKDYKVDILFICYNRSSYTQLSLPRLLETSPKNTRIWIWLNGTHKDTMDVVYKYRSHPKVFKFYHSEKNVGLNIATNWLWENSDAKYIGKVDDDGFVSEGWIDKLCNVLDEFPQLGVLGCWHFHKDDFNYELSKKKMLPLKNDLWLIQNCWVSGNGYIMKREIIDRIGILKEKDSFTGHCIRSALQGWVNGWLYPLVYLESMDDPRSKYTILKTDEDIIKYMPLSAKANGVKTLDEWVSQLKRSALRVQKSSIDPKMYIGWRKKIRGVLFRIKKFFGYHRQW